MEAKKSVSVWIGSELGILKAVNLVGKTATNYFDQAKIGKDQEIISISRDEANHSKLYTGHKKGFVREFDSESGQFERPVQIPDLEKGLDELVKIYRKGNSNISCTRKGRIAIWRSEKDGDVTVSEEIQVGPNIYEMAVNKEKSKFATGGKENPLKVYDFENHKEPVFKAKNVPHDWLQLRVPIWVTGIQFLQDESKIVTSTGTSKVRLYDITTPQRRPCIEMNFDEYPLTAITLTQNPNLVIVGNTRGNVGMFDFRKKDLVRVYKGFAGSVRCLQAHPTLNYVASCGLDRFLRIHEINSGKLEYKVYLKARLNCLLFCEQDFVMDAQKLADEKKKLESRRKRKVEEEVEEKEDDPVWRKMKTVEESSDEESSSNEGDD